MPKSLSPDEDFFSVPIFIQNYNQVSYLKQQLQWLVSAGYQNLFVLSAPSSRSGARDIKGGALG
jgi:hypothetical protein